MFSTNEATLDQINYASRLTIITHPQLKLGQSGEVCSELRQQFLFLQDVVAKLAYTRFDVVAFIHDLQRHSVSPSCNTFDN